MTSSDNPVKIGEINHLPKLYKITNLVNSKIYIGSTRQKISKRWAGHISKSSCCLYLKHSINKYGKENFKIEVLAVGDEDYISEAVRQTNYSASMLEKRLKRGVNNVKYKC